MTKEVKNTWGIVHNTINNYFIFTVFYYTLFRMKSVQIYAEIFFYEVEDPVEIVTQQRDLKCTTRMFLIYTFIAFFFTELLPHFVFPHPDNQKDEDRDIFIKFYGVMMAWYHTFFSMLALAANLFLIFYFTRMGFSYVKILSTSDPKLGKSGIYIILFIM